ncbi:MAG: hypothetical protein AAF806_26790 [Bacteroidota bacterium]
MKAIAFVIVVTMLVIPLSQEKHKLNRDDWIYWQDDKPLTSQDYKGEVGDCGTEVIDDSVAVEAMACLAIWSVLDVPKNWKKGSKYEKFYFVPVFNTQKSWTKTNDSSAILKQQVFFDMNELSARWARRELYSLRKKTGNATGTTANFYATVEKQMQELKQQMYTSYFNAVFRTNSLDNLQSWVNFTTEMLEGTEAYKTTEIEFERLFTEKPEKGYKKAKWILGAMD